MSDSEYVQCEYCGCDYLWPEEVDSNGKCKACIVNDCLHKEIVREYEGSNVHRVRFTEHCIKCGVFREIRLYFRQGKTSDWDHEEVSKGDIHQ